MGRKKLLIDLENYSITDLREHLKSRTAKNYTASTIQKIVNHITQQEKECEIITDKIMKSGLAKLAIFEMTRRNENLVEIKKEGNKTVRYHLPKTDNPEKEEIRMAKVLLIMQEIINLANTKKAEEQEQLISEVTRVCRELEHDKKI